MKHADVIAKMTLAQKCALLSGGDSFGTHPFDELGIPRLQFSDGPHGLRLQKGGANHLGIGGSVPATCFPTAATVANSWDPTLGEELGAALGEEACAEGVHMVLGPGLNIKRNPLCGRNFEYFSEDPLLAGKMAAAYVRGIQSKGVSACPKHFAVNSQETRRQSSDSVVDERALREVYLSGFETVVKEGKPKCIMTSYNKINGVYANENHHLLQDILHDDWGYEGSVVTDWGGSVNHAAGVREGSTFEMPAPGNESIRRLVAAVETGEVSEADINARVDEALTVIFDTKDAVEKSDGTFNEDAHHEVAHKVAAESIVLLKNEDNILPLAKGASVCLIGEFAAIPRYQGAGSSQVNPTKLDTMCGCVGNYDLDYKGYAAGFKRDKEPDSALIAEACRLAKSTDVVLLCLGLEDSRETEGAERLSMDLSDAQTELLHAITSVNKNIVVILSGGSSITCPWLADAKAVVDGYLGGQAGSAAMLDVLTGCMNPSGKLAESWPKSLASVPFNEDYPSGKPYSFYKESIFVGYRYYSGSGIDVEFPFGYGLSYTSFKYTGLKVLKNKVTFTLTNKGDVDGAEVAQVYLSKPDAEVFRPEETLATFTKVFLKAGESQEVTLELSDRSFSYFNTLTNNWEIEAGEYEVLVGASSADIKLRGKVKQTGTDAPNPYAALELPSYAGGDAASATDEEFEALLGRKLPTNKVKINGDMCIRDLNHSRAPLFWLIWWILTKLIKSGEKKGKPNLNLLFPYNMPLHALPKMTMGAISEDAVSCLILELKGLWIIGLLAFIVCLIKDLIINALFSKKIKS